MKTIVVVNDGTPDCVNAAKLAAGIALKTGAKILTLNTANHVKRKPAEHLVLATTNIDSHQEGLPLSHSAENTGFDNVDSAANVNVSHYTEIELARLINLNNCWMVIKGMAQKTKAEVFDFQSVLNRVLCPLMLVPEDFNPLDFERIVYLADLRYCRLQVVKFLAAFAGHYQANLLIANVSARGLPHMDNSYAVSFFNEVIGSNIDYGKLKLCNTGERSSDKAIDVIINGMHADLITLINHQFHFEDIVGRNIGPEMPSNIPVPLLIFPY